MVVCVRQKVPRLVSRAHALPTAALILALKVQAENARYTAVSIYLWVHTLNAITVLFNVAQVVLAALAGWKVLTREDEYVAAVCGLSATSLPALLKTLGVSDHATKAKAAAAEYTALRDRFTRAAEIDSARPFNEFSALAAPIFDRMDKARREYDAAPELFFLLARRKVRRGHMDHDNRETE